MGDDLGYLPASVTVLQGLCHRAPGKPREVCIAYIGFENYLSLICISVGLRTDSTTLWIKAVRRRDAIEIFYSFDDKDYVMMRNCRMQENTPVMVGMVAACPDGDGFRVIFDNFSIKHLPDARRLEWLKQNQE